jgi:membrane protease YdiL (CAAX protease family)
MSMVNTSTSLEKNQGKIALFAIMTLTVVLVVVYWWTIQSLEITGLPLYFMQLGLYLTFYLLARWGMKQEGIFLPLNTRRILEAAAWSLMGWLFFVLMLQLLGLAQLSAEFHALMNVPAWKIGAKILSTWFFVGMGEEVLFRGYFLKAFWRHFTGESDRRRTMNAILLSSTFFSLWHLPVRLVWLISGEVDVVTLVISMVVLFLLGLGFSYLFVRSDNILLVGFVHGLMDYSLVGTNSQVTALILLAAIGCVEIARLATREKVRAVQS